MDGASYANILGTLKLDLQELGTDHLLLQDGNLSAHRTSDFEKVKGILEIEALPSWPSNSSGVVLKMHGTPSAKVPDFLHNPVKHCKTPLNQCKTL